MGRFDEDMMITTEAYKKAKQVVKQYERERNYLLSLEKSDGSEKEVKIIPKEDWGVHENHCCEKHGCKYGNPGCPVQLGLTKAEYSCEYCYDNRQEELYWDKQYSKFD